MIPSQPVFTFLPNVACLAEKKQILISVFRMIRPGIEHIIYHTQGEYANHYTTDGVSNQYN